MAADRTAHVTWSGSLMDGSGTITSVGSGAFGPLDVSWAARTEESEGLTSPEELIAAAHAACFSMALSHGLAEGGTPPDRLDVDATVTFVPGQGSRRSPSRSAHPCPGSTRQRSSTRPRPRRRTARSRRRSPQCPRSRVEASLGITARDTLRRWRSSASSTSWTAPMRRRRSVCPIPRSTTTIVRLPTRGGGSRSSRRRSAWPTSGGRRGRIWTTLAPIQGSPSMVPSWKRRSTGSRTSSGSPSSSVTLQMRKTSLSRSARASAATKRRSGRETFSACSPGMPSGSD